MLRLMLDAHPQIRCFGEVFVPGKTSYPPAGGPGKSSEISALRHLEEVIWQRGRQTARGCKIKYRQLEEQFPELLERVRSDHDVRIIHIRRNNLIKRYVSNLLAGKKMTPTFRPAGEQQAVSQPRLPVDASQCVRDIVAVQEAEQRFRRYFSGHPVFEVSYEALVSDMTEIMAKLQRFLGVSVLPLTPRTGKVNSDHLRDIIENYAEFSAQIGNTPYASWLDN